MRIRGLGRLKQTTRRIRNRFAPGTVILLYHRIVDLPLDPQLLCVTPLHFAEHLEVLRQHAPSISLQGLAQSLESRTAPRQRAAVTFDDGAADNLHNAKPILARYDVPATVFVSTGYVESGLEFWWDELERLLLEPGELPERLSIRLNGTTHDWQLEPTTAYQKVSAANQNWNVLEKTAPTARHRLYQSLCDMLRPISTKQRREVILEIQEWSGRGSQARTTHQALTPDEIRRLADGELVEIGAHTVTHPVLSAIPATQQKDEIRQSKSELENILGRPVVSFAYPYGTRSDYTNETVAIVREAGFAYACSNFTGVVQPRTDMFQLPRFVVRDWDGDEFERRLKVWFRG